MANYEITGELIYLRGAALEQEDRRPFTVVFSKCNWSIQIQEGIPGVKFRGVAHESGTLYYFGNLELSPDPAIKNTGIASIEYGEVPVENGTLAPIVWLSLASSCYFERLSGGIAQPLWIAKDVQQRRVKCEWSLYDGAPRVLKHAIYYGEKGVFPPPFAEGDWVAAEYRVQSETNVNGMVFPLKSHYTQFVPDTRTGTTRRQFEVRILVRQVKNFEPRSFVPVMDGVTLVSERRFRGSNPPVSQLMYELANGGLPNRPDAVALQKYAELTGMAVKTSDMRSSRVKHLVLLCMAISAGLLVWLVGKQTRKNNHWKQETL